MRMSYLFCGILTLSIGACSQFSCTYASHFEISRTSPSLSVIPLENLSDLSVDPSQAEILKQLVERYLEKYQLQSNVQKGSTLKLVKSIPMKTYKKNFDAAVLEIGAFGNFLWGIEWDTLVTSDYLVQINPKTGKILKHFPCPGTSPAQSVGLGVSKTDLWITNYLDSAIYQVDQKSGRLKKTYKVKSDPNTVAVINGGAIDKNGNFWFGQWDLSGDSKVYELDPSTGKIKQVLKISNASLIFDLAFDANGFLYTTIETPDIKFRILKIDPVNLKVKNKYEVKPKETSLAFLGNQLMTAYFLGIEKKYFLYKAPK